MNAHATHGSLNRLALSATLHCLTGCGIGEVLGLVIATWLGWGTFASMSPLKATCPRDWPGANGGTPE